jgi:hypothetical protein
MEMIDPIGIAGLILTGGRTNGKSPSKLQNFETSNSKEALG